MKHFFSVVLIAVMLFAVLPMRGFAVADVQTDEEIIHLDDGSYIVVELIWADARASGTRTAVKTHKYYNNDNVEQWRAVLQGTFTYTGTSATCTAASCNVTISDDAWYVHAKGVNKSGNAAMCELTMGKKLLGVTVSKKTISMSLTCDANGNLS